MSTGGTTVTTLGLGLAYLRHNWQRTGYNMLFFAVGSALMALVVSFGGQMERTMSRNLAGIDMVVGAKGSPLQLVLSAVFQADIPTGNIPLKEAEQLATNPMIAQAIPVALGDNVQGYRIVGTTLDYPAHYHAVLAGGRMFSKAMEAVLGSDVADALTLRPGQRFAGSHGLTAGGELHDFAPYTVTGVLKPTGTVLDRLILTPVDSVWYVHENDDDTPVASRPKPENREVTALLVRFSTPLAMVGLPRMINKDTAMQAAVPAMEAFRLRRIVGVGSDALTWLGGALVALASLGLLISMAEAMRQRLYDLALMRCFGAGPLRLLGMAVLEGGIIGLAGGVLGLLAAYAGGGWVAARMLGGQLSGGMAPLSLPVAAAVLAGVTGLALLGSLLPALRVYRLSIPALLANR